MIQDVDDDHTPVLSRRSKVLRNNPWWYKEEDHGVDEGEDDEGEVHGDDDQWRDKDVPEGEHTQSL